MSELLIVDTGIVVMLELRLRCDKSLKNVDFCRNEEKTEKSEYKKSCHDELEWTELNQLHAAVLELSKNCFGYKKLCIGLVGLGFGLWLKIDPLASPPLASHVDFKKIFWVMVAVCFMFWVADATAYFYQRKLREAMRMKFNSISKRNNLDVYNGNSVSVSFLRSLFNWSMVLYGILIAVIACVFFVR